MKCVIITGGSISDYTIIKAFIDTDSYVICVDGGLRHLEYLSSRPDIILGDFDSCDLDQLQRIENEGIAKILYPSKKDKTDTELAIDYAIEKQASEILIVGGTGTRLDHTLANIHIMLKVMESGIKCCMINENNKITLINESIIVKNDFGVYLSLIPLTTKVKGITTNGLLYELNDSDITIGMSLGVSNEIISTEAQISIKDGILIVIQSMD